MKRERRIEGWRLWICAWTCLGVLAASGGCRKTQGTDLNVKTGIGTGDTDASSDTMVNTEIETGTEFSDTHRTSTEEVSTDTVLNTEIETGTEFVDTHSTSTEQETDRQCVGKPDFTSCNMVNVPERKYATCSDGVCIMPGSGYDRSNNLPGPAYPLAGTGVTLCYSVAAEPIRCPGEAGSENCGDIPFCGQDAQYGKPLPGRFDRTVEKDGEAVVSDGLTGLTWMGCIVGTRGNNCEVGAVEYVQNHQDATEDCEQSEWGGYEDWRLPGGHELDSLFDRLEENPPIDPVAFPGWPGGHLTIYTSSYSYNEPVFGKPRFFAFSFGSASLSGEKSEPPPLVACVRGEPAPIYEVRFQKIDSLDNEPVVLDNGTGLKWQGCSAGVAGENCEIGDATELSWREALSFCEKLEWGGARDWRLPNAKELRSLVDERKTGVMIDELFFPNTALYKPYWTSTSYTRPLTLEEFGFPFGLGRAYTVVFGHGTVQDKYKDPGDEFDTENYQPSEPPFYLVRCVRG